MIHKTITGLLIALVILQSVALFYVWKRVVVITAWGESLNKMIEDAGSKVNKPIQ